MSDIKVRIYGEFQKKGFKEAEKATSGLEKSFKSLGKTLVGLFSAQQVVNFGRASIKAFSDDEKAASRLTQTVTNLGLAFEDTRVTKFISDLEATSGVLDDQLRPAFQSLLTTTGSVTKSQELLGLALDVSAGSGVDVVTVAGDLSKAYTGNTKSLAKYNTGLSRAELQTSSFADIQTLLSKQFAGQNAAYLDTYAGKVAILNVAYANMQETIGKGLVDAFQILASNNGIGGGVTAMDSFGNAVADTTRGIATLVAAFKDLNSYGSTALDLLRNIDPFNPIGSAFGYMRNIGKPKPAPFKTPMTISGSTDAQTKIDAARKKAETDAAKRAKELLALTKKQVKTQADLAKKKKEEGILSEAAKRFDLERIQIAAALGGQVTEVEKLRLNLMQAILDEDVKRTIELEGQLIKAEAAAKNLSLLLADLDNVTQNPFAQWTDTIGKIQEALNRLNVKIPLETVLTTTGGATGAGAIIGTSATSSILDTTASTLYKAQDAIITPAIEAHAEALNALAESELALANLMLIESGGQPNVEVTVNVEGSVIAEQDLTATILDNLYNYQKAGLDIRVSSVAI